jgi:hypothetical protein
MRHFAKAEAVEQSREADWRVGLTVNDTYYSYYLYYEE